MIELRRVKTCRVPVWSADGRERPGKTVRNQFTVNLFRRGTEGAIKRRKDAAPDWELAHPDNTPTSRVSSADTPPIAERRRHPREWCSQMAPADAPIPWRPQHKDFPMYVPTDKLRILRNDTRS